MNNEKGNTKRMCKVVYFDEPSVTDYVQIISGGQLEKTTELLETDETGKEAKGDGKAAIGIGRVFKALVGTDASAGVSGSMKTSFSDEKMARNIIRNTILTDFLNIVESSESRGNDGVIRKFSGYDLSVDKNSLTYAVMVSPYLSMLRSGSSVQAGDYEIEMEKMEEVLKNAKGYYDFIGEKGKSKVILRFNIKAFKNNYNINDLLKMQLSIYATKVGKTTLDMLDINKEFGLDFSDGTQEKNPKYSEEDKKSNFINNSKTLDVFDVLLAGVEAHG